MIKKSEKILYGGILLYLNKKVEPTLRKMRSQIVNNACNSSYLACENTLMQIKYILKDVDRKADLERLNEQLKDCVGKLTTKSRAMVTLLCLADCEKQVQIKRIICNKLTHTAEYYRYIDAAKVELYNNFFVDITHEHFLEEYESEPLLACAINYATEKTNIALIRGKVADSRTSH